MNVSMLLVETTAEEEVRQRLADVYPGATMSMTGERQMQVVACDQSWGMEDKRFFELLAHDHLIVSWQVLSTPLP